MTATASHWPRPDQTRPVPGLSEFRPHALLLLCPVVNGRHQAVASQASTMRLEELTSAGIYAPMLREGARILRAIIDNLDVRPMPDGNTVRFAFVGDGALLDRLAVWGAGFEDLEPEPDLEPDPAEDDARALPPLCETVPAVDVSRLTDLLPGVPQDMAGLVRDLYAA